MPRTEGRTRTVARKERSIDNVKTRQLLNYAQDRWIAGDGNLAELTSAIDGTPVVRRAATEKSNRYRALTM